MTRLRRGTEVAAALIAVTLCAGGCRGNIGHIEGLPPITTTNPIPLCNGLDPGPAYVRRLNKTEYNNSVRDLLGTTLQPAGAFPTEEKRLGFDDNSAALNVSPALAEQYMMAAEQLAADAVNNHWATLVACPQTTTDVDTCGQQFIASFGRRAYRHPLDADDTATLTAVFNAGKTTDFKTGVRLVITTALQSPRFLYRVEFGRTPVAGDRQVNVKDSITGAVLGQTQVVRVDDWEMAARLSYLLWRSGPDDALLAAAQAGELSTDAQIAAQAERLLADPKARAVVTDFHGQWLHVAELDAVEKDGAVFSRFTPSIAGLMRQEAQAFIDDVIWSGGGTLAALFTAPYTFANATLAQYYGLSGVTGTSFVKVSLDPAQRAGILTQGGLMSLLAKQNQTSPVHRGKFVREQLFCQQLTPPPPDIEIVPPELSTTLTTRERFSQHSADSSCDGCHQLMDRIGLGFENFDGAGIYRATENGQMVDATGEIVQADVAGTFNGPLDLQQKLAASTDVRNCVSTQWFRYAYGRAETEVDGCSMNTLKDGFASNGYRILDLVNALARTDAFRYRRVTLPGGVQ
jgi:hypothetical protein